MKCADCGQEIIGRIYTQAIISLNGKIVKNFCYRCFQYLKVAHLSSKSYRVPPSYADQYEGVWEMPKATLSYEALAVDTEGNVTEGAYRLKLEGNFKQHIEPIIKFIKASIPTSERTYNPTTYEWFYHEKWHPFMEQAFKGSHYTVVYGVTKEAFTELKKKQAEWAKQAGQSFQHKQYPTDEDIKKFTLLLCEVKTIEDWIGIDIVKNWTRQEAEKAWKKALRFFHPDLHPERAAQASELNEVFTRLKESYYIK